MAPRRMFWTQEVPVGQTLWVEVPAGKAIVITRAAAELAVECPVTWEDAAEWVTLSCAFPGQHFVPLATLAHPQAAFRTGGGRISTTHEWGDNWADTHGDITTHSPFSLCAPTQALQLLLHTGMHFQAKRLGPRSKAPQCMLRSIHLVGYLEDN